MLIVRLYKKDALLKYEKPKRRKNTAVFRLKRKSIYMFSKKSRFRLYQKLVNGEEMRNFITLTYPDSYNELNAIKLKRDIRVFLQWIRYKYDAKYCWLIEFTGKGVPHIHVLTNKFIYKKQLAKKWYDLVKCGNVEHLYAGTSVEAIRYRKAAYKYMCEYMKKQEQKIVPDRYDGIGRFWGCSRDYAVYDEFEVRNKGELHFKVVRMIKKETMKNIGKWVKRNTKKYFYKKYMDILNGNSKGEVWLFGANKGRVKSLILDDA